MFIARVHIGSKYMPGDRLPDELPEETLDWLTAAGAIIEREDTAAATAADVPAGVPAEAAAPETPLEPEDGDEYDDDAPEIDVMAGIVKEEAPEEAPAQKPRAAGRRKAKGGKNA